MKTTRFPAFAFAACAAALILSGCASSPKSPQYCPVDGKCSIVADHGSQAQQAGFKPKPPFLLNALADASESVANHTSGPVEWTAKAHATMFRALTPGFWIEKSRGGQTPGQGQHVAMGSGDRDYL